MGNEVTSNIVEGKTVVTQTPRKVTAVTSYRGPQGEKGDTGIRWVGFWFETIQYYVGDSLEHNGSSYFCKEDNLSNGYSEPGVGNNWETSWALMAKGYP